MKMRKSLEVELCAEREMISENYTVPKKVNTEVHVSEWDLGSMGITGLHVK